MFSTLESKTKKPVTVLVSLGLQLVFAFVLGLLPLIYADVLPKAKLMAILTMPPPPPPPPPPPIVKKDVVKTPKIPPRQFDGVLHTPRNIPEKVAFIPNDTLPPMETSNGPTVGIPGDTGFLQGLPPIVATAPPPPPPPVVKAPVVTRQITVGGNVQAANLIRKIVPVYPALAKSARIQGTVRFTAVISKDGTIQNLQLVNGHPMLVQAATDAVRQWAYRPTLLNGEAVEVVTQIDVNFTLSQ